MSTSLEQMEKRSPPIGLIYEKRAGWLKENGLSCRRLC